jgi:antitoxin ParD1/3/4
METETSVSLDSYYKRFVNNEVISGRYNSLSDAMESSSQLIENEEYKLQALRNELELGELSPMIKNFNPQNHLSELHKKWV